MSLDEAKRLDMINKYVEKADQCWADAENARTICSWSIVANRMYYALVNSFRALLLKDMHPSHTHNGIKSLIGMHYVVTGKLSDAEGKLYSQMETMREKADYDCYFDATEEDINEKFEPVHQLLLHIKELLNE